MSLDRILSELKNLLDEATVIRWTNVLRGLKPLKKEHMVRRFEGRLSELEKLDETMDEVATELEVTRSQVREAFRRLQRQYGLQSNYNQVKDAAIRQLLRYSRIHIPEQTAEMCIESRVKVLTECVKRLITAPKYRFDIAAVPEEPGIYAIYDADDSLFYVGKTKNLRTRILRNHRSGNREGSAFRKALAEDKGFKDEKEITQYIQRECAFKYLSVSNELSFIEHFAISVLEPRLNR